MTKKILLDRGSDDSSAAAEKVAGNEDLLLEIFLRLPVRSLIRFKTVSKQWSSLISDPQFGRNHTQRRNPSSSYVPSGIFFYNYLTKSEEIESVSLDDDAPNHQLSTTGVRVRIPSLSFLLDLAASTGSKMKILQSCNGLLLCRFTQTVSSEISIYCVYNPTTRKCKAIPQPCFALRESIRDFSLAFDPSESPHYRVTCVKFLSQYNTSGDSQIEIYSSETGVWRTAACRFHKGWHSRFDSGIYWNGAIHWIDHNIDRYYCKHFDINGEKMVTMLMPPKPQGYSRQTMRYFGECRGYLHAIYVRSLSAKRFRVLEKDRDTLTWSVKYQVQMSRLISSFPEIVEKASSEEYNETEHRDTKYAFSILSVLKGEKEEDSALVLTIPGKVISYNFKHKTSKVLCELPCQVVDTSRLYCVTSYQFIESLASV